MAPILSMVIVMNVAHLASPSRRRGAESTIARKAMYITASAGTTILPQFQRMSPGYPGPAWRWYNAPQTGKPIAN